MSKREADKTSKKTSRSKNKMPLRIALLAVITSVFAICGMEIVRISLQKVVNEYSRIVETDYTYVQQMNDMMDRIYLPIVPYNKMHPTIPKIHISLIYPISEWLYPVAL